MKKTMKRVFCLLLVVCMLSAEFPASVFAADPVSAGTGSTTGTSQNSSQSTPSTTTEGVKVVYNLSKYHSGTNSMTSTTLTKTNNFWSHAVSTVYSTTNVRRHVAECAEITLKKNGFSAYQIYVPADGEYDLSISRGTMRLGGEAEVYLVRDAATCAGTPNPNTYKHTGFSNTLVSNKIKNAVAYNAADADTAAAVKFGTVNCDSTASGSVVKNFATIPQGTVKLEKGYHLVVLKGINGFDQSNVVLYIRSFILSSGNGSALMHKDITADKTALMPGSKAQITAKAYLSNPDVAGATFRYYSADTNVVKVDDNGLVTGVAEGQTKVTVSILHDGVVLDAHDIEFTVRNPVLTGSVFMYDFNAHLTAGASVRDVTAFTATHNFWAYAGDTATGAVTVDDNGIVANTSGAGQYLALKLNVAADGNYNVSMLHSTKIDGALADVYILPGNTTDIAGSLTDANKLNGSVSFYSTTAKTDAVTDLGTKELAAGEYIVVFKATATGASGWKMYPGMLTLSAGDAVVAMDFQVSASATTLRLGKTATLTCKAYFSNPEIQEYSYTFKSLNKYAKVDDNGVITIVAAEAGTTTAMAQIEVTAYGYGKEAGKRVVNIEVLPYNAAPVTLTYNYMKGLSYTDPVRNITYAQTKGFWSYYADSKSSAAIIIHTHYGIRAGVGDKNWVALKVYVPQKGDYQMTQSFYDEDSSGGIVDVYVLPASIAGPTETSKISAALTDDNKIGTFDCYGDRTVRSEELGTVNFAEKGEYLLVFRVNGKSDKSKGGYAYIGTTKLTAGDGRAVMGINASVPVDVLTVGDKTQVSATAYLNDYTTDGISYRFESLTPAIAKVDATGVVTGASEGIAKIKVTANGPMDSNETVIEIPVGKNLSGSQYVYNFANFQANGKVVSEINDYALTHNFWKFEATNSTGTIKINSAFGIDAQNVGSGKYVAVKINVTKAGKYFVQQSYYRAGDAGSQADLYILPGNTTDIAAALATAKKIGTIDFTGVGSAATVQNLGQFSFDKAGDYIVVYKDGGNTSGTSMRIGNFALIGGHDLQVMDFEASVKKNDIKELEIVKTAATVYMSDGTTTTKNVSYTSSNKNVLTVDDAGVITAVKKGTATITAVAGKFKKTFTFNVAEFNGSGVKVIYDYDKYHSYTNPVRDINDYNKTHGFWKYYADSKSSADMIIHTSYGIRAGVGDKNWVALKVVVPQKGEYLVTQNFYDESSNGGIVDVYVLPGNTESSAIAAGLIADNKLGTFDCYGGRSVRSEQLGFWNFAEKGEYLLVFRVNGKSAKSSGGYAYIGTTTLYGGEEARLMSLSASTGKKTLYQGDTTTISATTYMSDGTIADIAYRYESLNDCAVVNRSGVVTGLKNGTAQIKVSAVTAGGESKEAIITINVKTSDPSGERLVYDFLTGLSHGTDVRKITYAKTLNTWEYYADGSGTCSFTINSYFGAWYQNFQKIHYAAFKLNVTSAGDYMFTQNYAMWYGGSYTGIYILPGDTPKDKILSSLNSTNKVGEIHMGSKSRVSKTSRVGMFSVPEAGEYLVVYKPERPSPNTTGWHMYLGTITLDGVNCLKTVEPHETHVNLNWGETHQTKFTLRDLVGATVKPEDCTITYRSADPLIASVDDKGLVRAEGHGTTTIYITAYDGVETQTGSYTVTCTDNTGVKSAFVDLASQLYVRETALAYLTVVMNSGNEIRLEPVETVMTTSDSALMTVENGTVTALAEGTVTLKASGEFLGQKASAELTVTIVAHPGKTAPTYYTMDMRNNAKENMIKYDWAQETRDKAVANGRFYLRSADHLYETIMPDDLPRNRQIGYNNGDYRTCRYCGADVMGLYGANGVGGWAVDPIKYPWKVQCKDCLRWFPSNDFESFYKLGLDDNGRFNYEKAWEENEKLKATGHQGYLVNELYPEKGEGWGVDDGYGARVYKDGRELEPFTLGDSMNGDLDLKQSATYIAVYMYYYWGYMRSVVGSFANAYIYTSDIAYARAGAILLDRIADVTPDYDLRHYRLADSKQDWVTTCGGPAMGVYVGRIDDPLYFRQWAQAADAFFPALNDPYILRYLSREAQKNGLENDKSSSQKIWQNWRDNLLILCFERNKDGSVQGNFGLGHYSVSTCARVLAEEPETSKMFAWILACNPEYQISGGRRDAPAGGDFIGRMITTIDRDGYGNEGAVGYNQMWLKTLYVVGDDMLAYGDTRYNIYDNPKFAQMFLNAGKTILSDSHTVQIADQGAVASLDITTSDALYVSAWKAYKNTPYARELAQDIYVQQRGNITLSYGIFSKDPFAIRREINDIINEHFDKESVMLSGFGYTALQSGRTGESDSLRSVWMSYGITTGHGHYDTLNMGIEGFGLNLSPDLGYPSNTLNDPTNTGWLRTTVAHNTVTIDETNMTRLSKAHNPYLFDDADYVKVMATEASGMYRHAQIFDRTMVMIKVDGDNSYYLDFFRVKGGKQHTYSFHAQSQGAIALDGINPQLQVNEAGQPVGTYAGVDVEFGERGDHYTPYAYMTKVRKDENPAGNQFTVDFNITDYRGAISNNKNIHLKMTQFNNFTPDEVAIVGGMVPIKKDNNPITEETDTIEYVLTQRKSKNDETLDSFFTTVFEPYRGRSYISTIEEVSLKVVSGKPGADDMAKALLVSHTNGRMDYVFYSTNNEVTYRVADTFNVRGNVGVYSLDGAKGTEIYRYVLGGDIIVDETGEAGVLKGTVQGFSKEFVLDNNYIDVNLDPEVAPLLAGQVIHVENDRVQNGAYNIVDATPIEGGVRINLGTTSLVRNLRNKWDESDGYIYNIAKGQRFEIHMHHLQSDLSKRATLTHLEFIGDAKLTPAFDPDIVEYTSFVDESVQSLGLKALASDPNATIKVKKGNEVQEGNTIDEINIAKGKNRIYLTVTAEDGMTTKTYFITVYKTDHICYGGQATCQEKAICDACGRPYGEIDPNYHANVELWNGKYATETEDGYSGDYYCIDCNLLASRGHVLKYEAPTSNWLLILLIATGVLFVGAAATVTTVLVVRKKKKVKAAPETEPETDTEIDPEA